MSTQDTLKERGSRYGSFETQGEITQALKTVMRYQRQKGWVSLEDDQKEALDQIASKISRILNGDPNYADSWHDIAGYATLIDNRLTDEYTTKDLPRPLCREDWIHEEGWHHGHEGWWRMCFGIRTRGHTNKELWDLHSQYLKDFNANNEQPKEDGS